MSIASAIQAKQQQVADAYTAVDGKGGTLPATQDLSNLPNAINSITELKGETKTVNPTTSQQTITPSSGKNGITQVTVNAVTSAIDSDIQAGNIKSGVNILGVNGTVTELAGETRTVSLTSSSSSGQTFTPSSGKNGITSITVKANNQARTVTPTKQQQSLTVNSGYSGNGTITVNAVNSSIDSNITAGNIKKDVTILGVTGTYEGSGGGGGGGGDIAIPHIKILRATSWEVVDNDSGINFDNIVTDNADNLPYLMFSPDDPDYPDDDWVLTGGFFMSAMRKSYATYEQFCPGISVGSFSSRTWYGMTFGAYEADSLSAGYGSLNYWYGIPETNSVQINVTWDVPS